MNKALKDIFIQVVEQHQGIINHLCRIYYHHKEDCDDTKQDIILQLWKSFPSFRNASKISTWIYKISLNTILSKLRKEKRQIKHESLEHAVIIGASTTSLADDNLQQLKHFIGTLKDLDKAIIVLYLEGYKNQEIASILNLTPTNVSTRLNRIKSDLKEKFKTVKYDRT